MTDSAGFMLTTGERKFRRKTWKERVIWGALTALLAAGAGKAWNCSGAAVRTMADATFETVVAAQAVENSMRDDYRGLINETRNVEAEHHLETVKQLRDISADVTWVKNFLIQAEHAPSGRTFHRGEPVK